jgi:hypothetical protein
MEAVRAGFIFCALLWFIVTLAFKLNGPLGGGLTLSFRPRGLRPME